MSKTKILNSPYIPRPIQRYLHENVTRFTVPVCHRRFGKSVWSINHIIFALLKNTKNRPQYAYVAPEKSQAKKIIWDYVKEFTSFIPGVKYYEAELKVEIPLGKTSGFIYLEGAENPDRLRGTYYDGVVLDEVAQMPKSVWTQVIRPALSDRQGWAVFIGTPKGKNYFQELSRYSSDSEVNKNGEWSTFVYKASETEVLPKEELESLRLSMDQDEYNQEYECSFDAVIPGSYYGKMLEKAKLDNRIGDFNWDPKFPVFTAWDLGGMNDATAIWFVQYINKKIMVIDYYEKSGITNEHLKVVKEKPYLYSKHFLPHDANKRNESTGQTRAEETRIGLGSYCQVIKRLNIQDGINAARSIIPICHFNEKKCQRGLEALSYYHSEYVEKHDVMQINPVHDWSSHGSDAFRYLALGLRDGHVSYTEHLSFLKKKGNNRNYSDNWDPLK